jgi:hypothetical protein
MTHARSGGRAAALQAGLGAAVLALAVWALAADVEGWNVVYYVPAWYGYLLILDAITHMLGGASLVRERPRELLAMMFWSVPFWFLFELFNLVLSNWYYVYLLRTEWLQFVFTWLAFATVFPACFFHAHLARTFGWFERRRWRPLHVGRGVEIAIGVVGLLSIVAPLVWPRRAFWLVWGASLWLPELANRRLGAPSLLRDLERGRPARLLQLLTGGMIAGFVWELFFNDTATTEIYTVPGLEDWKLFEMPLLGFLGFPVLALGAYSFYSLIGRTLRGGRYWDEPRRSTVGGTSLWLPAAAMAVALCGVAFVNAVDYTARSRRPLLVEMDGLSATDRDKLRRARVGTPERLQRAAFEEGVPSLAARTGVDLDALRRAATHATLTLHKGMGAPAAGLLIDARVPGVEGLVGTEPDELLRRLRESAARRDLDPPRPAEVRVWIRAASANGEPRR